MFKKTLGVFVLAIWFNTNPLLAESNNQFLTENPVYLMVNIHFQDNGKDCKASYANYTQPGAGHKILAVNTAVQIKNNWKRKGFIIIDEKNNTEVFFEYHEGRMQMSIDEYLAHITSSSPLSLDGFSEIDRKGIKDGIASQGMTKKGVMIALGYPATHKTPSLDSSSWIYWTNRFKTLVVQFNDKGIVTQVIQ